MRVPQKTRDEIIVRPERDDGARLLVTALAADDIRPLRCYGLLCVAVPSDMGRGDLPVGVCFYNTSIEASVAFDRIGLGWIGFDPLIANSGSLEIIVKFANVVTSTATGTTNLCMGQGKRPPQNGLLFSIR